MAADAPTQSAAAGHTASPTGDPPTRALRPTSWRLWSTPRPVATGATVQPIDPSIQANGSHLILEEFDIQYEELSPTCAQQHSQRQLGAHKTLSLAESSALLRRETRKREEWIMSLESHPKLSSEQLKALQQRTAQSQRYRAKRGHRPLGGSGTADGASNGFFSWLSDLCDSIIAGVTQFVEWVAGPDGAATFTALINGIRYAMNVIIDSIESACRSLQALFAWIGKAIADFIAWIGFLFTWGDIKLVSQVVSGAVAPSTSSAANSLFSSLNTWQSGNMQTIVTSGDQNGTVAAGASTASRLTGSTTTAQNNANLQQSAGSVGPEYSSNDPAVAGLANEASTSGPQDIGRQHFSNYVQSQVGSSSLCYCASASGIRGSVSATGKYVPPRMSPAPKGMAGCLTHHRNEPLPICCRCNKPRSFYRKRLIVPAHMKAKTKAQNDKHDRDLAALKAKWKWTDDDWANIAKGVGGQLDTAGSDSSTTTAASTFTNQTNSTTYANQSSSSTMASFTGNGGIAGKVLDWVMAMLNSMPSTALADAVTWLLTSASQSIYVPVLSELIDWLIGIDLTIANILSVVVAIPATITYKLIIGSAPLQGSSDVSTANTFYGNLWQRFVSSSSDSAESHKLGDVPPFVSWLSGALGLWTSGVAQLLAGFQAYYADRGIVTDGSNKDFAFRYGSAVCELAADVWALPWLYVNNGAHVPNFNGDTWEGIAVGQWIFISVQSGIDCLITCAYLGKIPIPGIGVIPADRADGWLGMSGLIFGAIEIAFTGNIIDKQQQKGVWDSSAKLLAAANTFNAFANFFKFALSRTLAGTPKWWVIFGCGAGLSIGSACIELYLVQEPPGPTPVPPPPRSGAALLSSEDVASGLVPLLLHCQHCGGHVSTAVSVTSFATTAAAAGGSTGAAALQSADDTVVLTFRLTPPNGSGAQLQHRTQRVRPAVASSNATAPQSRRLAQQQLQLLGRDAGSAGPGPVPVSPAATAADGSQPQLPAQQVQQASPSVHPFYCTCRQCRLRTTAAARRSATVSQQRLRM